MHTLNQHPDNEYDIDTGVVFAADALPTTALAARQLIADALRATGGAFSKEPEARTNAVTVWYAEGLIRALENPSAVANTWQRS